MNPKLLIFDGQDRVGKSSTMLKVIERRGYIDTYHDKSIISNVAYNTKYNRRIDMDKYLKFLPNSKDCIIIHLTCFNLVELKSRFISTNERVPPAIELYDDRELFEQVYDWLKTKLKKKKIKLITLDTSVFHQNQIVDKILEELEK